jgi:GH18 family chitinase
MMPDRSSSPRWPTYSIKSIFRPTSCRAPIRVGSAGLTRPFQTEAALDFPASQERIPSIEDEVKRFTDADPYQPYGDQSNFQVLNGRASASPARLGPAAPIVDLVNYKDIVSNFTPAQGFQKKWDAVARVPYLTNAVDTFISFDDEQAIQEKASFVRSQGLAGIFIFEITGDYLPTQALEHPLLSAAEQYVLNGYVKTP